MSDKDKLILLFNINIKDIDPADVYEFVEETVKSFNGWFDDSVKCIYAVTKNDDKDAVQNITDFPEDGMVLIKNLVKFYDEKDENALEIQIKAVKKFLDIYNEQRK